MKSLQSCPTLATPWTVACQAPLSMGFNQAKAWVPCPPPGDIPNPEIKPASPVAPALQADFFFFFTAEPLGKPKIFIA